MYDIIHRKMVIGKLKMSLFAFIVAICGIFIGLMFSFKLHPLLGIVITGSFFLAAYNINCVIVGKCEIWAWILLIIYLLNTVTVTYNILMK